MLAQGVVALTLVIAAFAYRDAYWRHFAVVHDPAFPQWWQWTDQGRYLRAARAWTEGSLDPARHWYFEGYPLLGAAMLRFSPGHPYYAADLACLLLTGLFLALLGGRLAQSRSEGRIVGALVFLVTMVITPFMLKAFIEPWTTTPTAPLSLAALLLTMRLWERPTVGRAALVGLVTASVVLFRPVDTGPLALAVAITTAVAVRRRIVKVALGGLLGAAPAMAVAALTYLLVFGLHASPYLQQSAQTGFEWRLIPLHWVTIFVSALPEFHTFSMAQTFPWIIPGVAGMVAALVVQRREALLRHTLVIGATALHCLLYLSYRDLHPNGLFRYGAYHYFKWCLPLLGLYAAFLLTETLRRFHWLGLAVGVLASFALFSWRMSWQVRSAPWLAEAHAEGPHTLSLPQAPRSVYDGLFVPARGGPAQIYLDSYEMRVGGHNFVANADFKAFPVDGGLVFTVLRPMPQGQAVIHFSDDVTLLPGRLRLLHARLHWRWPHLEQVVATYYRRWLNNQ